MHENEYLSYEGTQELISYIKEDIAGAQSAPAGNPLTLTDAAPINAESLVVEFSPKQDLHGQSAPYVGGAGKNKLPLTVDGIKAANTAGTWSGNTYTIYNIAFTIVIDNDGNVIGININGTPSGNHANFLLAKDFTLDSNCILSGAYNYNIPLRVYDGSTLVAEDTGSGTNVASGTYTDCRIIAYENKSISNVMVYPMIRLSTETDPTFAPYSNICPITGYTECEVDSVGKNLFGSEIEVGIIDNDNGQPAYSTDRYRTKNFIPVQPLTHIVFGINGTAQKENWFEYDENYNFLGKVGYINNFTTSAQTRYVKCYGTNELLNNSTLQLEYGTTATPYEPYHSSNATIQFGQTVYSCTLDVTNGVLTVDGATQTITSVSDRVGAYQFYSSALQGAKSTSYTVEDAISNEIPYNTASYGGEVFGFVTNNGNLYLRLPFLATDTKEAANTFLTANPLQVCYPLAEPFTIQLTPVELKLLLQYNYITTNGTTINLGYQPDNALGQVLGEAYKYTDKKTAGGSGNYMEKGVDYVTAGQELGSILGDNATAEGYKTVAYGNNSHAEGYKTSAYGEDAHVEGRATTATNYTHAEGGYTYANGYCSHSEGFKTCSNGDYAHAEGYKTCAYGHWNGIHHAEGSKTYAAGTSSHAEGSGTTAWNASHAEGENTLAGWASDGNIAMATHAEGEETTAFKSWAHSEGYRSYANGLGAHAEGGYFLSPDFHNGGSALGNASHAEGCSTYAKGNVSHAEGQETTAYGHDSHAEGIQTSAKGIASHAEGSNTTAYGDYSHVEGSNTKASGDYSHAEGYHTTAYGEDSHAEGYYTKASAQYSHASGVCTSALNVASCSIGHYNAAMTGGGAPNNTNGTAFAIGNGTGPAALSNAFSVQFNGTVAAAGAQVHPAADYAEFFEWIDGNPRDTDRVGYFVTIDKNDPTKITIAEPEDDYILGIVSGAPCVIGNGDCDVWNGMTIKDDFGRTVYIEPGIPKYNPNYDPTKPYVSRMDRKEWAAVGMLGVLPVHDDGTCQVGGFCTVGQRGYATKADKYDRNGNCYKVIERISDKVVKVIFR